jgi:hypothetical protein
MKVAFASHVQLSGFILSFLLSTCSHRGLKTEEQRERDWILKNRITKVTEYRTNVYLGKQQKANVSYIRLYNKAGLKIHETDFTSQGDTDLLFSYEYDSNNNPLLTTSVDKNNHLAWKVVRTYDKSNNRKELYHYLTNGTYKYRTVASYDSQGRITELAWHWTTGLRSRNVYAYDGLNKISDTEYSAEGNEAYQWKYKYDSLNNLVEAVQYYPGNVLTQKITWEFNGENRLIKQSKYQSQQLENYITFQYDSHGLLSFKTDYSSSGKPTAIFKYDYELIR